MSNAKVMVHFSATEESQIIGERKVYFNCSYDHDENTEFFNNLTIYKDNKAFYTYNNDTAQGI